MLVRFLLLNRSIARDPRNVYTPTHTPLELMHSSTQYKDERMRGQTAAS